MVCSRLLKYVWIVVAVWTAIIVTSVVWNMSRTWNATHALAITATRAHLDQERLSNLWAVKLGTVYAPVTEQLGPNPSLSFHADRDIQTPAGEPLTLLSPHQMLPHLDATHSGVGTIQERLTSLKPVDPLNGPDAWQRVALNAFNRGETEHSQFVTVDGRPYLRMIKPLIVERGCLPCHGRQGYRPGDIRGGLEAWTDVTSYRETAVHEMTTIGATHVAFWLLGLAGIAVGRRRMTRSIAEQQQAEAERHKLEVQVQQTQKLESLGVLTGGIAHRFNNLLTGVLGNASLALETLPARSAEWMLVDRAQRAAQRAAELTRQMLAYTGKGPFTLDLVDINRLVDEMVDLLEVPLSKQARLSYNLGEDVPLIEADAAHIRQVVLNLVTNASEAIGDRNGTVSVSTGTLECDTAYLTETWLHDGLPAGRYVYVDVADDGCGMAPDTVARRFDPFFTTKFTGRGLGLGVVLGIVRGHRGAIKVQSQRGVGTTFRVLFPEARRAAAPDPAVAPVPLAGRRASTVLVVDDEPEVLKVASLSLNRSGFRVLTAGDGQAALDVFREHWRDIDAVLLDLLLPRVSGEQVFQEMRRVRPDVRVIVSSGCSAEDASGQFDGTGFAGFIQKPYLASTLAERVRAAIFA